MSRLNSLKPWVAFSVFLLMVSSANTVVGEWSEPIQLTSDPGADLEPATSVHGETVPWFSSSCLTWHSDRDGDWNIYSRFNTNGGSWSQMIAVTSDSGADLNSSVSRDDSLFWAVWQSDRTGNWDIFVSSSTGSTWSIPTQITADSSNDENPCIFASSYSGTLWVIWETERDGNWDIYASCYNGSAWSAPMSITSDSSDDRRPCGIYGSSWLYSPPLVAWETDREGNWDIYYSVYQGGSWSTPEPVGSDTGDDLRPSLAGDFFGEGVWAAWENNAAGNFEVLCTYYSYFSGDWEEIDTIAPDSSMDADPAIIDFDLPVDAQSYVGCALWMSDRDGDNNIYSWDSFTGTQPVDLSPANDSSPATTGVTDDTHLWLWAIWQSDRDGDWNIYGSYQHFLIGVEERAESRSFVSKSRLLQNRPNPFGRITTIYYCITGSDLRTSQHVELFIFDLSGRLVRTLTDELKGPGWHSADWDGKDGAGKAVPTGVYLYRLQVHSTGGQTCDFYSTKKMAVLR